MTLALIDLDAGVLPQAELLGVLIQQADAQAAAHIVEEDVAGVPDGLGDVLLAVGAAVLAVIPALGLVILVVRIAPGVQNLIRRGDDALLKSGDGGDHLKGGARGIDQAFRFK